MVSIAWKQTHGAQQTQLLSTVNFERLRGKVFRVPEVPGSSMALTLLGSVSAIRVCPA